MRLLKAIGIGALLFAAFVVAAIALSLAMTFGEHMLGKPFGALAVVGVLVFSTAVAGAYNLLGEP
jgi:hypothetical protein